MEALLQIWLIIILVAMVCIARLLYVNYKQRINFFIHRKKFTAMRFEIYKDKLQQWRWTLKTANNKIIADSGEGYHNKQDALDMIHKIQQQVNFAAIIEK